MSGAKRIRLSWIKGLMLLCHALLLVFVGQWLVGQYHEQQEQLKKNLTKVFTDVQHRISDSLLLTHVIDPDGVKLNSCYETVQPEEGAAGEQFVRLSPQGMYRVLKGNNSISKAKEKELFSLDTVVFNEMFIRQMREHGWAFNSTWINNCDSEALANSRIFIRSDFFTTDNGVVIDNFKGYLVRRMGAQVVFAFVLISLTGLAFWITYRSLKAQIRLSGMKDDFINNMSHELKTPIATVKVTLEALSNYNVIDNPTLSREYLGMATAEMNRLELLATRVLNTSLMESGKISLHRESCDLKELVTEVLQSMQLRLAHHNARTTFDVSGNSFTIAVDKLHTQGVLVNLIDNSLKYSEGPADIRIALAERNGTVQLSVIDNGPGIPEEYTEKVFDKFFRIPTGNRHDTKGHGLGLSYAKQVMNLHNGNINVNNVAGGGCMFTLSF
jgi:signal transduction histidine kinase